MTSTPQAAALATADKGTESRISLAHECGDRQKLLAACLADATYGPRANWTLRRIHDQVRLVIADSASVACSRAMRVALVAGGDDVLGTVVGVVPIQMIGDKCALGYAGTGSPLDIASTPMALVRSGSDPLKEDEAGDGDVAGRSCEWMPWHAPATLASRFFYAVFTAPRDVIAAARAVERWSSLHWFAEHFRSACSAVTQSGTPIITIH